MKNTGEKTLESMSQAFYYNRWTFKKFEKFLKGIILEVGCGIGTFTEVLEKFGTVFAIDIEKEYINDLEKKYIDSKVSVGLGDIEKGSYFFNQISFDTIVCLNVLEHIEKDDQAINNMSKLLKDGGYLILLVPAHKFLYGAIDKSIGHFRRYGKFQLHDLLNKNGLKVLQMKRLNFLGAIGWFIAGRIFKDQVIKKSSIRIFNQLAPFFLFLENIIEPPIGTSILVIASK